MPRDPSPPTFVARLAAVEGDARRIANLLSESLDPAIAACAAFESQAGGWQVEVHFVAPLDEAALRTLVKHVAGHKHAAALVCTPVAPRDWVAASLAGLPPVRAGRFVVHGAHDRARVPPNDIGIEIEAALAFGTGHHGTTRGCLLALDALLKSWKKNSKRAVIQKYPSPLAGEGREGGRRRHRPATQKLRSPLPPTRLASAAPRRIADASHRRSFLETAAAGRLCLPRKGGGKIHVLDLGTGTGVLAIAAAKMLRARVLATDIDIRAVRSARANARNNHVAALVETVLAAGPTAPCLKSSAPFDLVLANILLGPLQRLAAPLARRLAPGARVVLSGLLSAHTNAAIAAYRAQGLALERRITLDGWATLVMMRPAA